MKTFQTIFQMFMEMPYFIIMYTFRDIEERWFCDNDGG